MLTHTVDCAYLRQSWMQVYKHFSAWFVLKKRTRNSRLTARAILQRSASEIMYQIRRKTRLTVLLLTVLVLHFTVKWLLRLVVGIVMRFSRFFFFFFFRKNVTERYRKKGERLHVEKKTKMWVRNRFLSVPFRKGSIAAYGPF